MQFEVLTLDNNRWSDIVGQANADIFYEPSYCRFMTEGTPHQVKMLLYQDELGSVFDVTLAKRVDSLSFFADVASDFPIPPIDLASPDYNSPVILAAHSDTAELLRRYRFHVDEHCRETGAVTEFVRFHPLSTSVDRCATFLQVGTGAELLYVDLREGYEKAYQGYRKGHKSTIKKAAREGAGWRILPSTDVEALERVFRLYTATMQKKNAKSVYFHDFRHFASMLQNLGDRILLVESLFDGRVASANMFLLGRKQMWFKYSGLDPNYRHTGAHTFMMDRVIHWASELGFEQVMLGGGIDPGDSTYVSKRGFTHESAAIHHGKKVHDQTALNRLTEAKQAYDRRLGLRTETAYFPSYWLTGKASTYPDQEELDVENGVHVPSTAE